MLSKIRRHFHFSSDSDHLCRRCGRINRSAHCFCCSILCLLRILQQKQVQCPTCTLLNSVKNERCEVCNTILPKEDMSKPLTAGEEEFCTMCNKSMATFDSPDVARLVPCSHKYHFECTTKYFKHKLYKRCPKWEVL